MRLPHHALDVAGTPEEGPPLLACASRDTSTGRYGLRVTKNRGFATLVTLPTHVGSARVSTTDLSGHAAAIASDVTRLTTHEQPGTSTISSARTARSPSSTRRFTRCTG
jgi:hypothetical protein